MIKQESGPSLRRLLESPPTGTAYLLVATPRPLAGRAVNELLYPLTFLELKEDFNLDEVLQSGSLPEVVLSKSSEERNAFLRSYVLNYLKLEIQAEHLDIKNR